MQVLCAECTVVSNCATLPARYAACRSTTVMKGRKSKRLREDILLTLRAKEKAISVKVTRQKCEPQFLQIYFAVYGRNSLLLQYLSEDLMCILYGFIDNGRDFVTSAADTSYFVTLKRVPTVDRFRLTEFCKIQQIFSMKYRWRCAAVIMTTIKFIYNAAIKIL